MSELFRDPKVDRLKTYTSVDRVDFDPGTNCLDDLAIGGDQIALLRLERMDDGTFWGRIHYRDGREIELAIWASKGKLMFVAERVAA